MTEQQQQPDDDDSYPSQWKPIWVKNREQREQAEGDQERQRRGL